MHESGTYYEIKSYRIKTTFDEFKTKLEPFKDHAAFIIMHIGHYLTDAMGNQIKRHPIYCISYNPDSGTDKTRRMEVANYSKRFVDELATKGWEGKTITNFEEFTEESLHA